MLGRNSSCEPCPALTSSSPGSTTCTLEQGQTVTTASDGLGSGALAGMAAAGVLALVVLVIGAVVLRRRRAHRRELKLLALSGSLSLSSSPEGVGAGALGVDDAAEGMAARRVVPNNATMGDVQRLYDSLTTPFGDVMHGFALTEPGDTSEYEAQVEADEEGVDDEEPGAIVVRGYGGGRGGGGGAGGGRGTQPPALPPRTGGATGRYGGER
jgi:hypothetical protein